MGKGVLAGEKTGPVRTADRNTGNRIGEIDTLVGQEIDVGGTHFGVAHVAVVHRAPLVGEEVNDVGMLAWSFGGFCAGGLVGPSEGTGRTG